MASPSKYDPFIQCLDDLHKLINIRHSFYLQNQLELKSRSKFVNNLIPALDLLITKKAHLLTQHAPPDMPISLTLRIGQI